MVPRSRLMLVCGVSWPPPAAPRRPAPLVPVTLLLPGLPRGLWPLLRQQPCPHFPSMNPLQAVGWQPQLAATVITVRVASFPLGLLPSADSGLFSFPFYPLHPAKSLANAPHQPSTVSGHPSPKLGITASHRDEMSPSQEGAPAPAVSGEAGRGG